MSQIAGFTSIRKTEDRVTADKKRIINNDRVVDVNQLVPFKYKWAWQYYLDGCANHWMPQEVSMQRDIEQWNDPKGFTDDENVLVEYTAPGSPLGTRCPTGTQYFMTPEEFLARK